MFARADHFSTLGSTHTARRTASCRYAQSKLEQDAPSPPSDDWLHKHLTPSLRRDADINTLALMFWRLTQKCSCLNNIQKSCYFLVRNKVLSTQSVLLGVSPSKHWEHKKVVWWNYESRLGSTSLLSSFKQPPSCLTLWRITYNV